MITLDVAYDYDFLTLGISSREPAYRICWFLNKALGINLVREEENHLVFDRNQENHHVIYCYFCEEELIDYALIKNKSENSIHNESTLTSLFDTTNTHSYLIPEQSKIDYFLKISEPSNVDEIISLTRKIDLINGVFDIDVNRLKSKENLIFE